MQWGFIVGVWLMDWYLGFPASQLGFSIGCTVGVLYQWGWPEISDYFKKSYMKG